MSVFVEPQQQPSATEQFIQAFAPQALQPLQQFSELLRKQGETALQNRTDQEQLQARLASFGEGQQQNAGGQGNIQSPQGQQVTGIDKPYVQKYSDNKILAYRSSNKKADQNQGEEMSRQNKIAEDRYNADRKFALEQQKEQREVQKAKGLISPEKATNLLYDIKDLMGLNPYTGSTKIPGTKSFGGGIKGTRAMKQRAKYDTKAFNLESYYRDKSAKGNMPGNIFDVLMEKIPNTKYSEGENMGRLEAIKEELQRFVSPAEFKKIFPDKDIKKLSLFSGERVYEVAKRRREGYEERGEVQPSLTERIFGSSQEQSKYSVGQTATNAQGITLTFNGSKWE